MLRGKVRPFPVAMPVLTQEQFHRHAMLTAKSSAPGPDGVDYAHWAAAPASACTTLHGVDSALLGGCGPPAGFNDNIMCFLPKPGHGTDGPRGSLRKPSTARPFSLSNTDNKVVASAGCSNMVPGFA